MAGQFRRTGLRIMTSALISHDRELIDESPQNAGERTCSKKELPLD